LALIDDGIIDAVYTSGIKRVAWSRWSINPEGTELLVTTTYLNGQGEENRNVVLFRRVAPATGIAMSQVKVPLFGSKVASVG